MRIRTIKPEFFKHDGMAALPPLTRLLFIGLWSLADCAGRLEDRPARIKVEVLPYDRCDIGAALEELRAAGFIYRYKADELSLIEIPAFSRHQRITGKEAQAESRFPAYTPGTKGETSENQLGNIRETPETTGNGRETEGKRNGLAPVSPARARNPLFDALAVACGSDPTQMTARAARACGVALAEIIKASPTTAPTDFQARADRYRSLYREAALTPSALCAHWSECGNGVHPQPKKNDPYIEPESWRSIAQDLLPDCELRDKIRDGEQWTNLPLDLRQKIARKAPP